MRWNVRVNFGRPTELEVPMRNIVIYMCCATAVNETGSNKHRSRTRISMDVFIILLLKWNLDRCKIRMSEIYFWNLGNLHFHLSNYKTNVPRRICTNCIFSAKTSNTYRSFILNKISIKFLYYRQHCAWHIIIYRSFRCFVYLYIACDTAYGARCRCLVPRLTHNE